MGAMASQITSLTIVYSTVYSDADQRKHQSSTSLAFVTGEFPAQMASNAENVSIWLRHQVLGSSMYDFWSIIANAMRYNVVNDCAIKILGPIFYLWLSKVSTTERLC